jgi:hypothetical protein
MFLGTVFLVGARRLGATLLLIFSAFGAGASAVTLTASFVNPLPAGGVPAGSDVFASLSAGRRREHGPSLATSWGRCFSSALPAATRSAGVNRRLGLIVGGAVAPALGGSLTGLGEGGSL